MQQGIATIPNNHWGSIVGIAHPDYHITYLQKKIPLYYIHLYSLSTLLSRFLSYIYLLWSPSKCNIHYMVLHAVGQCCYIILYLIDYILSYHIVSSHILLYPISCCIRLFGKSPSFLDPRRGLRAGEKCLTVEAPHGSRGAWYCVHPQKNSGMQDNYTGENFQC